MSKSETTMFSMNVSDDVIGSLSPQNTSVLTVPEGCILKQVSEFVPWDNEHNLIPKQVDDIINILFTGIFLPLLFLISFSTNMVNMIVFFKHGLGDRINMCFFSLSLLDMLNVAGTYGYSSDVLYMFAIGRQDELGPSGIFFVQNYLIGLTGFTTASQVVSSVIAFERCLCITRPLLVKTVMSTKKTAIVLWSLLLIIIAGVFVGTGTGYTVICIFAMEDNHTFFQIDTSKFYLQNENVIRIFNGFIYGSTLPVLCAVCVTVCTLITAAKMKKLAQWRETVSSASVSLTSRDLAITRMVVGTSVLFIVCTVPSIALRVSGFVVSDLRMGGRYHNMYSVIVRTYILVSVVNCTINFFVYYVYGSKFRQTVHQMFFWCACYKSKIQNA